MANAKMLKKSRYFKELDDQDFQAILRCFKAHVRSFYKDEIIVHDGDTTDEVYIILQGYARTYSIDIDGNRIINVDFPKDSIYGIEYISTKQKYYHEYLTAMEDTIVLICDSFRFINPCQNKCKRHIDFMKLAFEEISRQLNSTHRHVAQICESKTKNKVLSLLKSEKAKTKKEYFTIPYNRQEMADYLGVERTALSAELSKLKLEGVIDFDKNLWKITKKEK